MGPVKSPPTRRRGGVQPSALSIDDVLDAGLAVVAKEGLGSLSTGSVARHLGVSAPAIYHYVAGNSELINLVCERVAMSVVVPDENGMAWKEHIVAIVLSMNSTFADYPGVAAHVLPFRRRSRAADRLDDAVREALRRGGFVEARVEEVLAAIHFIVGGWLLGRRPTMSRESFTPDLLASAVGWMLDGVERT